LEPTNQQKHQAGRYLAVGEALIRGYEAALVGSSTYIDVNGRRVRVQVATKGTWLIDDIDKYTSATIEHVVLVDITNGQREFYICPGDELRSEVRQRLNELLSRNNERRPQMAGDGDAFLRRSKAAAHYWSRTPGADSAGRCQAAAGLVAFLGRLSRRARRQVRDEAGLRRLPSSGIVSRPRSCMKAVGCRSRMYVRWLECRRVDRS